MTRFDVFMSEEQFACFAEPAVAAEKILPIDAAACVLNCRKAMEFAVKRMYAVEKLEEPYQPTLVTLMSADGFRKIVGDDLYRRMDVIRKFGNYAAHTEKSITEEQAELCLDNLQTAFDFIARRYSDDYATKCAFAPKPLELTEFQTRKIYIDAMLLDAGWILGKNWLNEVELYGMPNQSGVGYADYVLYDDAHMPLAVVEAKKTCVAVEKGRQQAKLYADLLEKKHGRRPVVFLTNGFETRIIDGQYPERKCAAIWSKRDLEQWFNLKTTRMSLKNANVDREIAGRYYQIAAIKAVCDSLDEKNRRKALLVMATGSGKTRTVIALCKLLLQYGWIKNILFLADRKTLVRQAKREFVKLLPDLDVTNLVEEKDNYTARCVFSTYQTLYNIIDVAKDDDGKLFTSGHFHLIICDEAHRSIYNKYKDLFTWFDAPLVGLTATPKDDIDRNTYDEFELEYEDGQGVPTYAYELSQAVKDGFLVDFVSIESKLKFMEEGIHYDELSEEEKEIYEKTFTDENGDMPEEIAPTALNEWIFNEDTIKQALNILMTQGLRINYGETLGKTIIFAKSHEHAEKILEVFNKEYPHLPNYAKVIDNYLKYADAAIDEFSDPNKEPRIAISVDMLDTGIDIPEILNLVFFKKVMSKAKFWQMIGRGTRLCPGLLDGADKTQFYIFDFCNNFEFFRLGGKGQSQAVLELQGAVFRLKTQIVFKLQDLAFQTDELKAFRARLVGDLVAKVRELNRDNFAVKQHLKYVDIYSNPDNFQTLTYENTLQIEEELVPLIQPDQDDANAIRFDALMHGIELAYLVGKQYKRAKNDLKRKVTGLASVANIPEIQAQSELIHRILHTDYVERAGINEFEHIRESLRDLMKYLPKTGMGRYDTNFMDDLLSSEWHESELENDDFRNYKAKAEFYIRQHQDEGVIAKLKGNIPLVPEDIKRLEEILWSIVGTREDYEAEYQQKPLGEFVREIVGLDMNAAKEAFAEFLDNSKYDSKQIYFVNQIVEYIVHNGMMKDMSVLQETPFTDNGSVVEVFTDVALWERIRKAIDRVNANAAAA